MSKKLNLQNWLERDDTLTSFVPDPANGTPLPITAQGWAEQILAPQLRMSVPREIGRLFEGARGALVYGYFYYALCMMGALALFRVAEAALALKRQQLEAPTEQPGAGFDENLQWLASRGVVQAADWAMISAARSSVSHLQSQEIIPLLEQVTTQINVLFSAPTRQ